MMATEQPEGRFSFRNIDWRWVIVGLCMFIVFHLLPMHIVGYGIPDWEPVRAWLLGTWGFAGVLIVGFVIGYLSKGYTVIEPGISGMAYVVIFLYSAERATRILPHEADSDLGVLLLSLGIVFVLAVAGAYVGERYQKATP